MEDYSLLIYLAFALISLGASGFKKYRENQQKREVSQADFEDQPVFQSELKEVVLEKEAAGKAALREKSVAHQKLKQANRERQKELEKMNYSEESDEDFEELFDEEFDAKKAVIYSEIINPPYL